MSKFDTWAETVGEDPDFAERLHRGFGILDQNQDEEVELPTDLKLHEVYSISGLWESLAPTDERRRERRLHHPRRAAPSWPESWSHPRETLPLEETPPLEEVRGALKRVRSLLLNFKFWRRSPDVQLLERRLEALKVDLTFPEFRLTMRELGLRRRWIVQIDGELRLLVERQTLLLRRLDRLLARLEEELEEPDETVVRLVRGPWVFEYRVTRNGSS